MKYYSQVVIPVKKQKALPDIFRVEISPILQDFTFQMQKSIGKICRLYKLPLRKIDAAFKMDGAELLEARVYSFEPYVSLLCLEVTYGDIRFMKDLEDSFSGQYVEGNGFIEKEHVRVFKDVILKLTKSYDLELFSEDIKNDSCSFLLRDAYVINVFLSNETYKDSSIVRKIVWDLQKCQEPCAGTINHEEESIRFVLSAMREEDSSYRWGCCITPQTAGFVFTDRGSNKESKERIIEEVTGYIFFLLLVLQQYFGAFYFSERISGIDKQKSKKKRKKELDQIVLDILEFRANNVIDYHGTSKWNNIQSIMGSLVQVMGLNSVINGLNDKVTYLNERQSIIASRNMDLFTNFVKFFGLLSLFGTIYSIVEVFVNGIEIADIISIGIWIGLMAVLGIMFWRKRY